MKLNETLANSTFTTSRAGANGKYSEKKDQQRFKIKLNEIVINAMRVCNT